MGTNFIGAILQKPTPTAAVTSFPRHPAKWFYHLWHKFRHPQELPGECFQSPRGEDITQLATDLFTSHSDEDFFQYVQYWDPHSPYRRSEQEVEQFRSYPLSSYPTTQQITDHQSWDTWRSAKALGCAEEALQYIDVDSITNKEILNELISHYDAEIRYVDKWIGKLLNVLREQQIYDETLIIITSDHGEEFGEHGVYREHWSTHEGTQRVPLLVKPPAEVKYTPGSRDQLVTNVDLAPTITNLAGIQTPASWQGQSLRSILEDKSISWRDRIVVDHGLYTAQRAVIADRWKFIRTYNAGMWEETVANRQLFDLKEDPWEQENVIESDPKIAEGLEVKMLEWAEIHRSTHEDSLLRTARIGPIGSDRHST